jgi:hypothetical protein
MIKIEDEFTDLKVSGARRCQLRRLAQGLCEQCATPKDPEYNQCRQCRDKAKARYQAKKARAAALVCEAVKTKGTAP